MTKTLSRRLAAGTLAVVAGAAGSTFFVTSASAHHVNVGVQVDCQRDPSQWRLKWGIQNSEKDWVLTVSDPTVSVGAVTALDWPHEVPKKNRNNSGGNWTFFTYAPVGTKEVTLTFVGKWIKPNNGTVTADPETTTLTKAIEGKCGETPPSTPPTTTAPPTTAPPTTAPPTTAPPTTAPPTESTPSTSATPSLPVTGTSTTMPLIGVGAALVAGGGALLMVLRRRRRVQFTAE